MESMQRQRTDSPHHKSQKILLPCKSNLPILCQEVWAVQWNPYKDMIHNGKPMNPLIAAHQGSACQHSLLRRSEWFDGFNAQTYSTPKDREKPAGAHLLGLLQRGQQLHVVLDAGYGDHLSEGLVLPFGAAASGQSEGEACVDRHHHVQRQRANQGGKVLLG